MTKKLVVVLVALSMLATVKAWSEEAAPKKKAAVAKSPKVSETRIHESDMNRLETAIQRAVIAKQGPGGWEYMAKKMKPPKNDKWAGRWNEVGAEGWEAIDHFENVYIFKRPAIAVSSSRVKPAESPAKAESSKEMKKEDKAKEKAMKDADKEKEKAAKKAEKEAKKADKEKEKAAKKAEKEAKKKAE